MKKYSTREVCLDNQNHKNNQDNPNRLISEKNLIYPTFYFFVKVFELVLEEILIF